MTAPAILGMPAVGQTTMANSIPVTMASDQPGATGGTSSTFGAAKPATGTAVGASDGTNMQPLLVDVSGYLKVNVAAGGAGGGAATVADGADVAEGSVADAAWSGTGSSSAIAALKAIYAKVAGVLGVTQSGTWTIQPGNTPNTTAWKVDGSAVTQPVSNASLPLPTGASTSAKQAAIGTAGSASADVISVQGVTSMTALKVDGSGVTQPVSIAAAPVLVAGTALIGKVGIDQTTPGTTNGVTDVGSTNWAPSQVSVANTATSLLASRAGRQAVIVTQMGTTPVYLGGSGVTAATGAFLAGVIGAVKVIPTTAAVYGITATGSQSVSVEEHY